MNEATNRLDCKRVSELMPLYAAHDLTGALAGDVASHVASCAACNRLADEFVESRRLLAEAFATPEFGADFYASIRGDVLARIGRDREPSPPASLLAALFFGRRFIYAASLAIVAAACLFAFQHLRHDARGTKHEIADAREATPEATDKQNSAMITLQSSPQSPQILSSSSSLLQSPQRVRDEKLARAVSANSSRRRIEAQRDATERHDATRTEIASHDRDVVAQAMSSSVNGASSGIASSVRSNAQTAIVSASPTSAAEVSRIEIQTADPNIRIIWLTPQKSEEPKLDRDKQENGDRK